MCIMVYLVGGLEHEFYCSIIYGIILPNWLIFFRGVETTNQSWCIMVYGRYMISHMLMYHVWSYVIICVYGVYIYKYGNPYINDLSLQYHIIYIIMSCMVYIYIMVRYQQNLYVWWCMVDIISHILMYHNVSILYIAVWQ